MDYINQAEGSKGRNKLFLLYLLLGLVVVGSVGFALYRLDQRISSLSKTTTGSVVLSTNSDMNYIVPPVGTSSSSSTSSSNKTTNTASSVLATLPIKEGLYQYGHGSANLSTGVRNPDATVSSLRILEVTHAASRSFPVIYYVDFNDQLLKITEINESTGERQKIITEAKPITSVHFSESKQALVYTVSSSNDQHDKSGTTKIYYLNSKKTVIVWEDQAGSNDSYPRWSPDGKQIAATVSFAAVGGHGQFWIYTVATGETKKTDFPTTQLSTTGSQTFSANPKGWTNDNQTLLVDVQGYISGGTYLQGSFGFFDVTTGAFTHPKQDFAPLPKGRLTSYYAGMSGKVIGFTGDMQTSSNDMWLFVYDRTSGVLTEYPEIKWVKWGGFPIFTQSGDTVVYYEASEKVIKVIDVPTKTVRALEPTRGQLLIPEAWNGSEENFISLNSTGQFVNINLKTGKISPLE